MVNNYKNNNVKYLFFILTIILSLFIMVTSFGEEKTSLKRNYFIINPTSGVERLVSEDGVTISKTETGIKMADIYHEGRQEGIVDKKIYNDVTKEDMTKYIRTTPRKKGPADELIDGYKDKNGNYILDKVKNNDFYVQKEADNTYTFVSTKYNYTLEDIKKFGDFNNVVDQKAYYINVKNGDRYLIDDDGRPVILYHKYSYSRDDIILINKELIFVKQYAGSDSYMMIKRGKKANEHKKKRPAYADYVYYGEKQKEEGISKYLNEYFTIDDAKVVKIENRYYVKVADNDYGESIPKYCLIADDGSIVKNAIVKEDLIFLKNNGKYTLYNADGKPIYKNIENAILRQLNEINFMYDEFKNFYIIEDGDKFAIIDKLGNKVLDNIDGSIVNTSERSDEYYKKNDNFHDKYFSAKVKNKYNVYSKDMKVIGTNDDIFKLEAFSDGDYYLLHNNGKYRIYYKNGNEVLSYEKLPGREKNNSLENLMKYSPSTFYDYRRYYFDESIRHTKWYNIDAYQDNDIWAIASGQWMDVEVDFPDFQFEDINGDLAVFENGKYNLYDKNGKKILSDFKLLSKYDNDYILFMRGFKYGLIDRNGNVKFEFSIFDGMEDDE